jgi:hypothetical protein
MLQYAQSTSLIIPSLFPIQKGKDDSSYQVCLGGWVRRLRQSQQIALLTESEASLRQPFAGFHRAILPKTLKTHIELNSMK